MPAGFFETKPHVIILAVDTALGACSVALLADGRVAAHEHRAMLRGHAEALAPMVEALMRESGIGFAALNRIAVTTGPGTFTGQRVGLAFARALGVALKTPVIGVTTLDCLAEEALTKQQVPWAIAAADARRGEIYLGARSRRGETLIAPELIGLDSIGLRVAELAQSHGRAVVLAGTAAELVTPFLATSGFQPSDSFVRQPDALFVAKLAASAAPGPSPKPLYLRAPDAKLPGPAP
jgi:tRNA threonylcarbamoyladenosine biosynthesis protein TsaB